MMKSAAFLDRDGVINSDLTYVYKREDFHFLPGVFEAVSRLRALGFLIVVVTNQSGIARGLFTEKDFAALNQWMLERFAQENAPIDGVYYCPHHPEGTVNQYRTHCGCRKPMPGMFVDAARDLNIDLHRSVMFGDKHRDLQAAKAAGVGLRYLIDYASSAEVTEQLDPLATARFNSLLAAVVSSEFGHSMPAEACK